MLFLKLQQVISDFLHGLEPLRKTFYPNQEKYRTMTSKRKLRTLILVWSVLSLLLVGTFMVQNGARTALVQAQSSDDYVDGTVLGLLNCVPRISFQSPENKTYNSDNLTAQFTINSGAMSLSEAPTSETNYFPKADSSNDPNYRDFFYDVWFNFFVGANLDFDTSNYVPLFDGTETGNLTTPASLPVHISQYMAHDPITTTNSDLSNNTVDLTNLTQGPHTLWFGLMLWQAKVVVTVVCLILQFGLTLTFPLTSQFNRPAQPLTAHPRCRLILLLINPFPN